MQEAAEKSERKKKLLEEQRGLDQVRFAQFRSPTMGGADYKRTRAIVPDRSLSPARIITYGLYEVCASVRACDSVSVVPVVVPVVTFCVVV